MKKNYDILMEEEIQNNFLNKQEIKPTLLLHSCCAPCSCAVIEYLHTIFDITIYYYNPNITEKNEFEKRCVELENFLKNARYNIKMEKSLYNPEIFFSLVKGLESVPEGSERCFICYKMRLESTAKFAKKNNYSYFASVLSISPLKKVDKINEIGEELEKKFGVKYLYNDFKKKNRYLRSVELSKEYGLYRQDYCGCIFSKNKKI
ncbi:epoxyqueuosine reductase QueH [Fusobacterium sp. PH5-44]|uniref:epoxyqueuosine reductase QueH n=1 Tax=unclassified Fusobacterium TaxID=2648384 RepID=UPI003D1C2EAD